MSIRLSELAELVEGSLNGDGQLPISGAASLSDAGPGFITFADREQMLEQLEGTEVAAVVVPHDVIPPKTPYIVVDNPRIAFTEILQRFRPPRQRRRIGISPAAHISPSANIADDVDIHPGATVGDDVQIGRGCTIHAGVHLMAGCQIGEDVTIFPGAVFYEETIVGDRCRIHAGVVLGADGFGYDSSSGTHQLIPQIGTVEIGCDVEIGANTTIDRATFGVTRIGDGTKIDNMVMIGHNCQIGKHNLLCSQVGIAGSSTTGDYVVMAGQVGVRDHCNIAGGVQIGGQAGVTEDLKKPGRYLGSPAIPARQEIQMIMSRAKLVKTVRRVKQLEKTVAQLNPTTEENDSSAA
jgi:UDP-3-O-[3-hydroxymyristoyl] glucosamine N-acyltransferase